MVTVVAHRGARSLAPENTLAAARKAYALGADLWETDVAVTAAFSTYSLAEIRTLDAGPFIFLYLLYFGFWCFLLTSNIAVNLFISQP